MSSLNVNKTTVVRVKGQVKWFDLKAGYGFLSVGAPLIASEFLVTTADVFVHHTNIKLGKSQFRYLVHGEAVEFDIAESANDKHKFQALNVTAASSSTGTGKLLCEVKNEERMFKPIKSTPETEEWIIKQKKPTIKKPFSRQ